MKFNAEKFNEDTTPQQRVYSKWEKYDGYVTESLESGDGSIVLADGFLNPDFKNRECIGKEFWLIGYGCRIADMDDDCLSCVLIDDDYNTYSTISNGVATVIAKWIDAGVKPGFDHKIRVRYEEGGYGMRKYYTLKWVKNYGAE